MLPLSYKGLLELVQSEHNHVVRFRLLIFEACALPSYMAFVWYPRAKGIFCSVCLSVRPSVHPGNFISHFVREAPPTVFPSHYQNLYYLKAGCLEYVMGVRFSLPPTF